MPRFIAEEDTIRLLTSSEKSVERGGGKNPLKDWFDFLLATHGPWRRIKERRDIRSLIGREKGLPIPKRAKLYMSDVIDAKEINLTVTMALIEEFKSLDLYLDVIQFPAYVKLSPAKYDNTTPSYLPNSRIEVLGENGEPTGQFTRVKWQDWKDANNEHREFEGSHYVPLSSNTRSNDLSVSLLSRLDQDNYQVKSMRSYPMPTEGVEV